MSENQLAAQQLAQAIARFRLAERDAQTAVRVLGSLLRVVSGQYARAAARTQLLTATHH